MTSSAAGTTHSEPALDRLQSRTLGAGLLAVSLAVAGTRLADSPGWVRAFDNLHWTLGYCSGALLAWTGWRRRCVPAQRLFAIGLIAYFVGQVCWDIQVAVDWNPFPGPSDLFYVALGPCLALGLITELRAMKGPSWSSSALDLFGLSAAALAYTLSRYLPLRGDTSLLQTATLVAYPVALSTTAGAAVLTVLARRLRVTPAFGLFIASLLADTLLWAEWNMRTLKGTLGDGIFLNYCFSYAAIGLGLGCALWHPREVESVRVEGFYYVLSSALPVLLALGAGIALQQSPSLPAAVAPWVQSCSLLIVATAVVRQSLLLAERERRLAAELEARILADQYRAIIVRQEQTQRLEALGTLAAGVAHDFNNLLMAIRAHAELARRDPATLTAAWDAILGACERGAAVVSSMLAFGRQRSGAKHTPMAVPACVRESQRLLRAVIPSNVAFEIDLRDDTPAVVADPTQMQQVLVNLATNAAHAIGERPGTISIATRPRHLEAGNPHGVRPGDYAELVLADDGDGMDDATRPRIFEPFFTTKGPEKGTGMGLAVVHGIVTGAGGVIECESAPGRGTRFTLYWPAAAEPGVEAVAPAQPATSVRRAPAGAPEVLVIDDEASITLAVTGYLRGSGIAAAASNDPLQALELVRADPRRFAAIVCDLAMPRMRGDELCREVRRIAPELPVVLSTGGESDVAKGVAFAGVLTKPYKLEDLAVLLTRLLATSGTEPGDGVRPGAVVHRVP